MFINIAIITVLGAELKKNTSKNSSISQNQMNCQKASNTILESTANCIPLNVHYWQASAKLLMCINSVQSSYEAMLIASIL